MHQNLIHQDAARRKATFASRPGAILTTVALLLVLASAVYASDAAPITEELHQVYPLSASGRISIDNLNGPVHIAAWDRNEVKLDAVKSALTRERLDEAKIEIKSQPDSLSIKTNYPDRDRTFWRDRHDNPASVEYTLMVPRNARLDEISLINGSLEIKDVAGDVHASCINGHLQATNLEGRTHLSSVNGMLEASVSRLPGSSMELSAVNGALRLTLPSDANADVEASTVSGGISNDFGVPVTRGFVGHSLHAQLGGGGTHVRLSNVNGHIEIFHAKDNRPLSPAKNLNKHDGDHDDDHDDTI